MRRLLIAAGRLVVAAGQVEPGPPRDRGQRELAHTAVWPSTWDIWRAAARGGHRLRGVPPPSPVVATTAAVPTPKARDDRGGGDEPGRPPAADLLPAYPPPALGSSVGGTGSGRGASTTSAETCASRPGGARQVADRRRAGRQVARCRLELQALAGRARRARRRRRGGRGCSSCHDPISSARRSARRRSGCGTSRFLPVSPGAGRPGHRLPRR